MTDAPISDSASVLDPASDLHQGGLEAARTLLAGATRVTVLTGAGISTESGIPDFRGPQGLWTRNPKAELTSTLQHYLNDDEVRRLAWAGRVNSPAWSAEPNDGHRALVDLEASGRLDTLVTQNIDGLHAKAGTSPERIVEVHGTIRTARCWNCGRGGDMEPFLDRVRAGEDDPRLQRLRRDHQERHDPVRRTARPRGHRPCDAGRPFGDVLLAVGTTLSVYPVAGMVPTAVRAGAAVIIVNGSATDLDDLADVVVRATIGDVLPALVAGLTPR